MKRPTQHNKGDNKLHCSSLWSLQPIAVGLRTHLGQQVVVGLQQRARGGLEGGREVAVARWRPALARGSHRQHHRPAPREGGRGEAG